MFSIAGTIQPIEVDSPGFDLAKFLDHRQRPEFLGEHALPSLSWDATVARQYALRAVNPSHEKRVSVARANWLAVTGLSDFPSTHTAADWSPRRGGRLEELHLSLASLVGALLSRRGASLLRRDVTRLRGHEREALGITQVFRSAITRPEQGGTWGVLSRRRRGAASWQAKAVASLRGPVAGRPTPGCFDRW